MSVFSHPAKALFGSMLAIAGGSSATAPMIALVGLPLVIVGGALCVHGTLVPAESDEPRGGRDWLCTTLLVLGTIAFAFAAVMTSAATGEDIVASKRGQISQGIGVATIISWLVAPGLLTLGNRLRASEAPGVVLLRALYWFLHFPAIALGVHVAATQGVPFST